MRTHELLFAEAGDGGDGGGGSAVATPAATPSESGSIFAGAPAAATPAAPAAPATPATPSAPLNAKNDGSDLVSQPFFHGLYDQAGKLNKAAFDRLPEHLKKSRHVFERFDTIEALLHGAGNAFSLAGRKGDLTAYQPPAPDAPEQVKAEHAKFLQVANRVPATPEEYPISKPDEVSQEAWDNSQMGDYLKTLHKHHASPELASELFALNKSIADKAQVDYLATTQTYSKGEIEKLQGEFKSQYPEVRAQAERVLGRFGLDDSVLSSAANVKAFYQIAKALGEDKLPSHQSDPHGGLTDRQKALDIINNKNNPMYEAFHDPRHPQHAEAVALRSKLNASWAKSQGGRR